jgi:hypothetical protein
MKNFIGLIFLFAFSATAFSQQFQIRNSKVEMLSVAKSLYVLDGKILPDLIRSKMDSTQMVNPITEINSEDIEKMEIIKGETAILAYGEAGRNGVVKITMKKPKQN